MSEDTGLFDCACDALSRVIFVLSYVGDRIVERLHGFVGGCNVDFVPYLLVLMLPRVVRFRWLYCACFDLLGRDDFRDGRDLM